MVADVVRFAGQALTRGTKGIMTTNARARSALAALALAALVGCAGPDLVFPIGSDVRGYDVAVGFDESSSVLAIGCDTVPWEGSAWITTKTLPGCRPVSEPQFVVRSREMLGTREKRPEFLSKGTFDRDFRDGFHGWTRLRDYPDSFSKEALYGARHRYAETEAAFAYLDMSRTLQVYSFDQRSRAWILMGRNQEGSGPQPKRVRSFVFAPRGNIIAVASDDGRLELEDLECNVLCELANGDFFREHCRDYPDKQSSTHFSDDDTFDMTFSPDGRWLAVVGRDVVGVWRVPPRFVVGNDQDPKGAEPAKPPVVVDMKFPTRGFKEAWRSAETGVSLWWRRGPSPKGDGSEVQWMITNASDTTVELHWYKVYRMGNDGLNWAIPKITLCSGRSFKTRDIVHEYELRDDSVGLYPTSSDDQPSVSAYVVSCNPVGN
jgi:hypothetical protein